VRTALRIAAVSMLALSLAACGGGGANPDEQAINDLVEQFFQAFRDGDGTALASLFGAECGDMTDAATSAIEQFHVVTEDDVEIDIEKVDIRDLTETSAQYLPQVTLKSRGEEAPLAGPDEPYTTAVKENGAWKIAECDLFL